MINTETAQVIHTTVADQSARYPIAFEYDVLPDTLAPELLVTLDGNPLTYGIDYTVDAAGLQLVDAPEANKTLVIKRDVAFTQEMDFQTGLIDPDQIEDGFDRSVMRDQELKRNILDVAAALAAETEERITADTILQDAIDAKQDAINDLSDIRSGAAAGATALQPTDLATVATTGSYNDLSNRPTIPATAADVHALPDTTKYGASLALSVNPTTFVVTAQLKDQNNSSLGAPQTIDLPLESVVVSGAYDSATKEVVLTLESGSTVRFSVADLVSGLQTEITSVNLLDADLVDDTSSAHKFVSSAEKAAISTAVQPGDLATVATSGSYEDLLNKPTLPTVNNATITFTQGGATKGTITLNQSSNETIELDAGGGGSGDYVLKTGDTMTGTLTRAEIPVQSNPVPLLKIQKAGEQTAVDGLSVSMATSTPAFYFGGNVYANNYSVIANYFGSAAKKGKAYLTAINNGADIAVPATGGTMVVATPPASNGTYVLKATVVDGVVTTTWVAE